MIGGSEVLTTDKPNPILTNLEVKVLLEEKKKVRAGSERSESCPVHTLPSAAPFLYSKLNPTTRRFAPRPAPPRRCVVGSRKMLHRGPWSTGTRRMSVILSKTTRTSQRQTSCRWTTTKAEFWIVRHTPSPRNQRERTSVCRVRVKTITSSDRIWGDKSSNSNFM